MFLKRDCKTDKMEIKKIDYKIFNNLDDDLAQIWKSFEKDSHYFIFQKFDFIKDYTINNNSEFYFVVLYFEKKVIGVLPLEVKKKFSFKILCWVGSREFDYCGPLISDFDKIGIKQKDFKSIWLDILKKIGKFDVIYLDKQKEKFDFVLNPFSKYLNTDFHSFTYSIDLPKNIDDYFERIEDKKFKGEFLRTEKKLFSEHKVELKNIPNEDNSLKPRDIIKQKISNLKKNNKKHFLDNGIINKYEKFYENHKDIVKISTLKLNDNLVAANLGFNYKKTFYYYMPTIYNTNFKKYSPGKVIISFLIRYAISEKLKNFDFGLGDEKYKKYWSNKTDKLNRHLDYKTFKGWLVYLLIKFYLKCRLVLK